MGITMSTAKKSVRKIASAVILHTGLAAAVLGPVPSFANEVLNVVVDQTVPYKFDRGAQSVVVGNPSIADVIIQNDSLVFVLGRNFGTTNLYALDEDGNTVANLVVQVEENDVKNVSLFKQTARQTLVCPDTCNPTLMVGDSPDDFNRLEETIRKKTAQAKDN